MTDDAIAPGYAVLVAKPASEFIAESRLRERGYRSYCPKRRVELTGHRPGRGESIFRPLFPRYLFAELHTDQEARPMLWAQGVCSSATWALWRKERPRRLLSAAFVDAMRIEEDAGMFDPPRREPLKIGNMVRPTNGPFADLFGRIVELDDDEKRAVVLLDILGGTRAVFAGAALELVANADRPRTSRS